MYHPSLEEVKSLRKQGNLVPVYKEIRADLETPVSAFLKIARGDYSFLLESVEGGERLARYSFIGTEPSMILASGGGIATNPLDIIRTIFSKYKTVAVEGLPRFHGGMVGYLSYEVARHFERLPSPSANALNLPETCLLLADTLLIFDHVAHVIKVVSHVSTDGNIEHNYRDAVQKIEALVQRLNTPLPTATNVSSVTSPGDKQVTANVDRSRYESIVENIKQHIFDGDIIQAVPSMRIGRSTSAEPFSIYRALRSINPSPYMYYLHLKDFQIVGASPELLVRVEDGVVSYHPIAGTRPRGKSQADDIALADELKNDEKERAEHIMLVDLARNDIGRISEPGSVEVTQLFDIERYSHVMHLVSHVQGRLREGLDQFDAFQACFPAGTVSGAPKIRAMEIIAELEPDKRGPYAGAVGYFDFTGNMDTAIAIRTLIVKDGVASVQAGAGIVADSDPANEYQECMNKAQALLSAIDMAEAVL